MNGRGKPIGARIRLHVFAFVVAAAVVYAALALIFHTWNPLASLKRELPLSFDGDSTALKSTQIVPTLDTPIEAAKNVVWCATLAAGWKQLQQKVTSAPVNLKDAAEVCARLNAAPDPAAAMPADAFYANAGTIQEGIVQTVNRQMSAKFPQHKLPEFGEFAEGFLFYSYLEARVPFTLLYRDNPEPLEFTGGDGVKTPIRSFGFRKEDRRLYRLKEQPTVLMVQWEEATDSRRIIKPVSYAIDLCKDSKPYQIVAARVPRKESLAATLDALDGDIKAFEAQGRFESISDGVLEVPDLFWRLSHRFRELEGHVFQNPELAGQLMAVVRQDIQFRLDRTGAEVTSEAYATAGESEVNRESIYQFDGPFLLYIKLRGEKMPFFAMWIDNAELLQRWGQS